jgi:hypothetical protein
MIEISLTPALSNDRCFNSPRPVLPSQPHFEIGKNSFEISSSTKYMGFLNHDNSLSCFIHYSSFINFY